MKARCLILQQNIRLPPRSQENKENLTLLVTKWEKPTEHLMANTVMEN